MKTVLKGTAWSLIILCLLFTQCKKTPDTPVTPKSSAKSLTNPAIDGVLSATSIYDAATSTYTMTVPSGTVVTALKLTFNLSAAATANPAAGSSQNFTNPITYIVTAEDGSTQNYVVKVVVTVPPKSTEKQITEFKFAGLSPVISATINQTTRKIDATVSANTSLAALVPTVTLSTKAVVSPASGVAQNFARPVSYTVTAEDGSVQTYEVTITQEVDPAYAFLIGTWRYQNGAECIYNAATKSAQGTKPPTNNIFGFVVGEDYWRNVASTGTNKWSYSQIIRSTNGSLNYPKATATSKGKDSLAIDTEGFGKEFLVRVK